MTTLKSAALAVSSEHAVPVAELLQTLVREISDLAQRAEQMQHLVSPLLASSILSEPSAEGLQGLQELDLIAQRLHGLSRFVDHLEPSPAWRLDIHAAVRAVPLADLARRLTGPSETHVVADTAGGELFLFD